MSTQQAATRQPPTREAQKDLLVWIDCEVNNLSKHTSPLTLTYIYTHQMTGLSPETDEIIEIHCIVTGPTLALLDPKGFSAVIHVPETRLKAMSQWCIDTHTRTGLWDEVLESKTTHEEAAENLLKYIQQFAPRPRTALLAGSSVHCDKAFLSKGAYAKVMGHLHYRILDVSSIKEAARRWCPGGDEGWLVKGTPKKTGEHRARGDILESIREARYYMESLFRPGADDEAGHQDPE
jgi:oligoribonuclease (3'-5' exoribonuclease)